MDLFEYQAKELFAEYGVPVQPGKVAHTAEEARDIAAEFAAQGHPLVVVKAQVKTGGRGKAGGVKLANGPDEAYAKAGQILGMDIKGHTVHTVLIAQAVDIAAEYYLSFLLDRAGRTFLSICTVQGGMEIEEVAHTSPEAVARIPVSPLAGVDAARAAEIIAAGRIPEQAAQGAALLAERLWAMFAGEDATLVEVNPLALTGDGQVVQPPGERHRRRGIVGRIGRDFQRYVAVHALGFLPRRPEQGRRLGQVLQRQGVHQVLSISDASACQAGQRAVIVRSGGHGMPEDRGVGRQPGDRQVTHVTCQRPGAQHDPVDAIQPQALAKAMQPLRGIQLSVHAYLPDGPTRSSSPSQGHTSRLWRPGRGGTIIGPIVGPSPPTRPASGASSHATYPPFWSTSRSAQIKVVTVADLVVLLHCERQPRLLSCTARPGAGDQDLPHLPVD